MVLLSRGKIFWRIVTQVEGDKYVSKKKFWTARAAIQSYYDHQDRHGFPVVKYSKRRKNGSNR